LAAGQASKGGGHFVADHQAITTLSFRGARRRNPTSNDKARGWIPGPAVGRPGMTLQVDCVQGLDRSVATAIGVPKDFGWCFRRAFLLLTESVFVMRGLDPRIHLSKKR
jgi:hypothetical protein